MTGTNNKSDTSDALDMPQSWHPDSYQENAAFVAQLGSDVLTLLDPKPDEAILDLGCGDGVLTEKLAKVCARAVGIDASAEQIKGAQDKGLEAYVMDGASIELEDQFDAVFSNAALHWMPNADAVIEGVRKSLKPGGRFVAEFGGFGNVQKIKLAMEQALDRRGFDGASYCPWYFPTVEEYQDRLKKAGFQVDSIKLIDRPTALPGDVTGWLKTFAESYLNALPETEWDTILNEVREELEPLIREADGVWYADYVRLRFAAHLRKGD